MKNGVYRWLAVAILFIGSVYVHAQTDRLDAVTEHRLDNYFVFYKSKSAQTSAPYSMTGYKLDNGNKLLTIMANDAFAAQDFTTESVAKIYRKVANILPSPYNKYKIRIAVGGISIDLMATDGQAAPTPLPRVGAI